MLRFDVPSLPITKSRASFRWLLGSVLVTLTRAYIRYAPVAWGKRLLWSRMKGRILLRKRRFVTST